MPWLLEKVRLYLHDIPQLWRVCVMPGQLFPMKPVGTCYLKPTLLPWGIKGDKIAPVKQ